jgi:3-deoxy-D-arabino-heptulosonate 7-phosphate (DAHP) synthase class II
MPSKNEAWMELHRLAAAIEDEGLVRQERMDSLVNDFLQMPPLVRRELLRELQFLLSELADVEPLIIQAANAAEDGSARSQKTG